MGAYAGRSFGQGVYRLHDRASGAAVDRLVARAFAWLEAPVSGFGYDWLGRQFALDPSRREGGDPLVLMLDFVEGRAYRIPAAFAAFHDETLVELGDAALASDLFAEWAHLNPRALPLKRDQVVGYRIPLALGGKHELANLELAPFAVEIDLTLQIAEQVGGSPESEPAIPVEIDEDIALDSPHGRFLAEELADLGIDPALPPSDLQRVLHEAIAARGDEATYEADEGGWLATLQGAGESFHARSIEAALAWSLLYLRAPEYGPQDDDR